ncbi:TIGR03013 family XrtA/PEP-CTERM system glycosyltransferase [uncultured Piscinibacter sp.]|uniref:TIGR03013 family XrtA/PEP-CTERM system glycosyltransferase n=1 Tax=uncultured Piscinibacter sp. TaxID=1131835 RepID=UPI0026314483|nr:TIGR03013 family XrtA/PEP-CTERM system glycosyltransferase [uncultured Piscinibacter sp.]
MLKVFQHHIPLSALAELLADGLFCFLAVVLAAQGLSGVQIGDQLVLGTVPSQLLLHAAAFALLMSLLYSVFGIYRSSAVSVGLGVLLSRASLAVLVGAGIAYSVISTEGLTDRASELLFPVIVYMLLGLVVVRLLFHVVRRAVVGSPRVLIVGTGKEALSIATDLRLPGRAHRSVVGFYPAGGGDGAPGAGRVFDRDESISSLVRRFQIDEVIVAVREQRGGAVPMDQLLECRLQGTPVLDLAGFYERTKGQVPTESLKASWLVYGHGFVQGRVRTAVKRAFDVVCSTMLLVLASPVMLVTALLIRLDSPGPIIYRQERVGLGGRSFMCLKFRSMCTDAERDGVARWASKNDARVTRVGAFIRKCRIDELPQLISVLKGEMSLVGPRPERPSFVAQLREQIPFYDIRHSVKPGVTGWAQVRYSYGASVEDARRKHEFDLYYVKNNSLFLDLLVLVETVSVVLFREGAQ